MEKVICEKNVIGHTSLCEDGYGGAGCEKVTKLSRRTLFAKAVNVVALCVAGASVFGALVYLKKPVKQDTSTVGKLAWSIIT